MNELNKTLCEAETIMIAGHVRPDGDCIGACVALQRYIKRNYPKKEVVLKQNIEKTMYLLIEYVFSYRIEELYRVRLKYLKSVVIQISMLDYYMRVSYNKKIINAKRYNSISGFLIEMRKIAYGVIRSEKLSANVS